MNAKPRRGRDDFPVFNYEFDTDDAHREVTIFDPDDDRLSTHWITVDVGTAVSIERCR